MGPPAPEVWNPRATPIPRLYLPFFSEGLPLLSQLINSFPFKRSSGTPSDLITDLTVGP